MSKLDDTFRAAGLLSKYEDETSAQLQQQIKTLFLELIGDDWVIGPPFKAMERRIMNQLRQELRQKVEEL